MNRHRYSISKCVIGRFEIPNEDSLFEQIDMVDFKLYQLGLKQGDRIRMEYDFGTTQAFWLELTGIEDMKRGWGRHQSVYQ